MFVDSHCHIYDSSYKSFLKLKNINDSFNYYDIKSVKNRAVESKVNILLNICTSLYEIHELIALSEKYYEIYNTIGIHPDYVKEHLLKFPKEDIYRNFQDICQLHKTIGIGEIGLDYYKNNNIKEQKEIFDFQLSLAEQFNLPVSIHSRESWKDTLDILSTHPRINAVIHCFSGDIDLAKSLISKSYMIGIGGILTFKKSQQLQEAVKWIPLDYILLETDAPWLAPEPFRGKVNEPSFIPLIANKIAFLKNMSISDIELTTTKNFYRFFRKIKGEISNE